MTIRHKFLINLLNYLIMFVLLCGSMLISSCDRQERGFALPEGDIEKGKVAYERLACNECHSISNVDWRSGKDSLKIHLGGEVTSLKTYGDLVTSVINPSHKVAGFYKQKTAEGDLSMMKNYNEVMTVQELIDVVTFLQSEYEVVSPPTKYYPYH